MFICTVNLFGTKKWAISQSHEENMEAMHMPHFSFKVTHLSFSIFNRYNLFSQVSLYKILE